METTDVHVYIGKYTNSTWSWLDINGMNVPLTTHKVFYRKCEGLENYGKAKNIYQETYADSNTVRVDFPTTITREATTITLDIVVKRGTGSLNTIMQHLISILGASEPIVFWDNVRKKMAVMSLTNAVEPKEDTYKGMNYLECEFKFQNLIGYCPTVNDTYANSHLPYVEAAALPIITRVLS